MNAEPSNPLEQILRQAQQLLANFSRPCVPDLSPKGASRSRFHVQTQLQPVAAQEHALNGLPVSKEDLGRATWTFLHTLAAQYPERPNKGQQKDVRALVRAKPACCGSVARK